MSRSHTPRTHMPNVSNTSHHSQFSGANHKSEAALRTKAVLGPTNTGKTHYAIERMLAYKTGMIGLPLRLLAREIYQKICERVGKQAVALITGEERIVPKEARYWIATLEAMPQNLPCEFVAIDEIQTATDFDRGHVFTQRLLSARGTKETLLLGAATMAPIISALLPGIEIIERPRLSELFYAGSKKITRVPPRTAIIAFSAQDVYAIAELVRRERGGAAVVMGALSPRTRNAQVELYQNGDVDILVATDAIGMGLNLDIDHVAFSSDTKFDGRQTRPLTPAELGQIAGRAGRHTNNGSFGVTGHASPFEAEMVERLQTHDFDPVKILQWRNSKLDFSSPEHLRSSLEVTPSHKKLTRVPINIDQKTLERLLSRATAQIARTPEEVELLWQCCQIPDYRNISPNQHAEIVTRIFTDLMNHANINQKWIEEQVRYCDNMSGDIDTLSNRIKQIRTWTFLANKKNWLNEQTYWQHKTRDIENRLSDALHERLTQRFVDKRTSILIRHLRDKRMTTPEISPTGDISLEGHTLGSIEGFRFKLAKAEAQNDSKSVRSAAAAAVAPEILNRARRLVAAPNDKIILTVDGFLRWKGEIIAELSAGDDLFAPKIIVLADECLTGVELEQVQDRLNLWLRHMINTQLEQILTLRNPEGLDGAARGIAFRLSENFGILPRAAIAQEVKGLDQDVRGKMRRFGIRFGAYHIYLPLSLKPAPRELALTLYALHNGGLRQPGVTDIPSIVLSGRTSFEIDPEVNSALYEITGFKVAGKRAVRVDILERLADIIRPLISFDTAINPNEPPEGAAKRNGFVVTVQMTSLLGCAGEDFAAILKSLGYRVEKTLIKPEDIAPGAIANGDKSDIDDLAKLDGEAPKEDKNDTEIASQVTDNHVTGNHVTDNEGVEALQKLDGQSPAEGIPVNADEVSAPETPASKEPEEPQYSEIWFPVSRKPHNAHNKATRKPNPNKQGGKRFDKGSKPNSNQNRPQNRPQKRNPPREKPMDPDSPFAALAALKIKGGKK